MAACALDIGCGSPSIPLDFPQTLCLGFRAVVAISIIYLIVRVASPYNIEMTYSMSSRGPSGLSIMLSFVSLASVLCV